jgi:hypothetical protein
MVIGDLNPCTMEIGVNGLAVCYCDTWSAELLISYTAWMIKVDLENLRCKLQLTLHSVDST